MFILISTFRTVVISGLCVYEFNLSLNQEILFHNCNQLESMISPQEMGQGSAIIKFASKKQKLNLPQELSEHPLGPVRFTSKCHNIQT